MSEINLLVELVKQHAEDDSRRFEQINEKLDYLTKHVDEVRMDKAKMRGAMTVVSAIVSAVVALVVAFLKGAK